MFAHVFQSIGELIPMARLTETPMEQMTEAQRNLHEKIASGPRGGVRGPFLAWLKSPAYLEKLEETGRYLRYDTLFEPRLSEFAILITARFWGSQYEWYAHEPLARKGGLSPEIIEAVQENRRPQEMANDEAAIYDFCIALHENHFVSDEIYQNAFEHFGERGLVELIGLIGHYTTVSMTLNAFKLQVPEGTEPPLK